MQSSCVLRLHTGKAKASSRVQNSLSKTLEKVHLRYSKSSWRILHKFVRWGTAQKTAWARLEQPPLCVDSGESSSWALREFVWWGCSVDCIGLPRTAPWWLIPARVHRVTVVDVLAPCLGELEDGLEGRGVSPDDMYNQMFKWFGGSCRSAWDT